MPGSPVTARNRGLGARDESGIFIWCDMTSDIQKAMDKVD